MDHQTSKINLVLKNIRVIAAAVIITAIIVGGGIYWQKNHQELINKEPIPYVSWYEAVQIVNSGQVKEIVQDVHNYDVTLILKNGTSIKTRESRLDEIVGVRVKCGPLCKDISFSLK